MIAMSFRLLLAAAGIAHAAGPIEPRVVRRMVDWIKTRAERLKARRGSDTMRPSGNVEHQKKRE